MFRECQRRVLSCRCVSKDPGIEDRIQFSLRENLKDIGKRCIHELRNFIDSLRADHTSELF